MEYIIIGLLVIILILVVVSITKNINEANITERLGKLELGVTRELSDFLKLSRQTNKEKVRFDADCNA